MSVGLNPPEDALVKELSETFGIKLNHHNFCSTNPFNPIETITCGHLCEWCISGTNRYTGVGSNCQRGHVPFRASCFHIRRGKLNKERIYPEERNVEGVEPRVGVFVCHCGANIGRVVDVPFGR